MPRMEHQKLKLLYLSRILLRETDENHPMTITRMMDLLRLCGVEVRDRKSLYSDLEALGLFGLDILSRKNGRSVGYFVASREFELPELRLLVDAVQSSRFVTRKKTDQLISKLETLCSAHQAGELQREVFVSGRVKTMNESIYYSVDVISAAIAAGERITFRYFSWAPAFGPEKLEQRLHRNGEQYTVSPWALVWSDENYYLAGGDELGVLRHFRVDKLLQIQSTGERRLSPPAGFDPAAYGHRVFGMFGGAEETVRLSLPESLLSVTVDRFGRDLLFSREDGRVVVTVRVEVSPPFLAWVFSLGPEVKVLEPASLREHLREQLAATLENYE
jgi:Predicted transcriptional regulator